MRTIYIHEHHTKPADLDVPTTLTFPTFSLTRLVVSIPVAGLLIFVFFAVPNPDALLSEIPNGLQLVLGISYILISAALIVIVFHALTVRKLQIKINEEWFQVNDKQRIRWGQIESYTFLGETRRESKSLLLKIGRFKLKRYNCCVWWILNKRKRTAYERDFMIFYRAIKYFTLHL